MRHENCEIDSKDDIVHHGIGKYFCRECDDWVWGLKGQPYIDIISVDRTRGTAYLCYMSGVPREDYPAVETWETNIEVPLSDVEGAKGWLPDGYQEPWVRMLWRRT